MTVHRTAQPATGTSHDQESPQENIVVYHGQADSSVRRQVWQLSALPGDDPGTCESTGKTDILIAKTLNVLLAESIWKKLCAEAERDDVSLTTSVCAILLRHSFSLPD
jgi:hypothetical protein